MEEARIVELPAYHVVRLRYEGASPPAPGFFAHWDRFNDWAAQQEVKSPIDDVWAIGYAPPGPVGSQLFVYDACIPVAPDVRPVGLPGLELGDLPGGRFVLCAGIIREFPALLYAAKRYAMAHGLAIERGYIELYRPHPDDAEVHPVDAGYRIHD